MKKLRVLGVGLLLSTVLVAPGQVFAESVVMESGERIEVASTQETSAAEESTESTEIIESAESTEATEGTVTQESTVEEESFVTESSEKGDAKKAQELKIWDLVYTPETRMISGKTEPNATIKVVIVSMGDLDLGTVKADSAGNFYLDDLTYGVYRLVAYLDDRESIPYEMDTETPGLEYSMRFIYLTYDIGSKTIHGVCAAEYATIHVSIPSIGLDKKVQGNLSGYFSITEQFTPGMEVILTPQDAFGNMGKSTTFVIPTQEEMNSLEIRDVAYDHATKTLTAKTAPNAYVTILSDYAQGGFQADENGNLVATGEFKPGSVVQLTPYLDGVMGEMYTYTIPEAPTNDLTIVPVKDAVTKPTGKEFPKTGATTNIALSLVGSFAVLVAAAMIITRKLAGKKG